MCDNAHLKLPVSYFIVHYDNLTNEMESGVPPQGLKDLIVVLSFECFYDAL